MDNPEKQVTLGTQDEDKQHNTFWTPSQPNKQT